MKSQPSVHFFVSLCAMENVREHHFDLVFSRVRRVAPCIKNTIKLRDFRELVLSKTLHTVSDVNCHSATFSESEVLAPNARKFI